MIKIDNLKDNELSEYIKQAYEEPGPYQIESWALYQLNHLPTPSEFSKADKILDSFEFNEDDEYLLTLRAKRNHIRNFILNIIRDIENNLSEFNEVFIEVKKDLANDEESNS